MNTATTLEDLKKAERARVEGIKEEYWSYLMNLFDIKPEQGDAVPAQVNQLFRHFADVLDAQLREAFAKLDSIQSDTERAQRAAQDLATAWAGGDLSKVADCLAQLQVATPSPAETARN